GCFRGAHQIAGEYAASAVSSTCKPGYQPRKVEANSWLSVLTRVCKSTGAPRLVHGLDCFLTKRLLSTELTVDSTNAVAIVSPFRYRFPEWGMKPRLFSIYVRNCRRALLRRGQRGEVSVKWSMRWSSSPRRPNAFFTFPGPRHHFTLPSCCWIPAPTS